jgi:hypothetical protein
MVCQTHPCAATPNPHKRHFKTGPAAPHQGPERAPDTSDETREREARSVRCRECLHPITREEERTSAAGGFQHTFANPHGIVFTIGCFGAAEGCALVGPTSDEFAWFAGFHWQVAVCGKCLAHMGWRFAAPSGTAFWGLILDHLVFPG